MDFILDLLFPNRCPCCGTFITFDKLVCDECELPVIKACDKCGKLPCECSVKGSFAFDKVFVLYKYDGAAANGITAFKHGDNTNFAKHAADLLARLIAINKTDESLIVPVPMRFKTLIERGYNQSEIISRRISVQTGIPHRKDILIRSGKSLTQRGLTAQMRAENVKSYSICDVNLKGNSIILCDDVLTTGSTANKCAELLKSKGAEKVVLAVIATTSSNSNK
ncbi:MAG: ComF family protein [Oscillospiraceae bacterium]|jgi:competence protein ComFC|nr:ComF family protein [Oscillospiraceae bacterium]